MTIPPSTPEIRSARAPLGRLARAVCLVACLLCCPLGTARAADLVDRVAAVVNGEFITLFEVNENLKPYLERFGDRALGPAERAQLESVRRQVVDRMINDILIKQDAARLNIVVSDSEVAEQVRQIRNRSRLNDEEFENRLKLEKLTRQEFEARLRDDMLRQRLLGAMVRRKVVVTPEEVQQYYDANKARYGKDAKVDLGLIMLPPGQDAEELRRQILAGRIGFEEAAKQYSVGPGAQQGGAIGVLGLGDINEDWRAALQGVKPGDLSRPFPVREYQALLKLKSSSAGSVQTLSEVQEDIREALSKRKQDEYFNEYMEKLRSKAVIDVKL